MAAQTRLALQFESGYEIAVVEFDFSYADEERNWRAIEKALIFLRMAGRQSENTA
jgi:hypothetical protein